MFELRAFILKVHLWLVAFFNWVSSFIDLMILQLVGLTVFLRAANEPSCSC